jgi:hypothetical protein
MDNRSRCRQYYAVISKTGSDMAKNPYEILGVNKDESEDDLFCGAVEVSVMICTPE